MSGSKSGNKGGGKAGGQGPPPAPKKGGQGKKGRGGLVFALLFGLLGVLLAMLAMDLHTVPAGEGSRWFDPGDTLLLDRLSAELGQVTVGEVVLVRSRTKGRLLQPSAAVRRVVAVEGEKVRGRVVERGHLLLEKAPAKGPRPELETLPVADVLAIARLRLRDKGERWAVDPLP